jgi:NAD+ kinase
MSKYNRLLLVIKQTAFASYTAREELARVAGQTLKFDHARMGRLRERHDTHMFQVERITKLLELRGASTVSVMREDLQDAHVTEADLVVALGGDGTTLIASHKLDGVNGDKPLLGVNTDRASPSDLATLYRSSEPHDMRRSTGHLCACTGDNVERMIEDVLFGKVEPTHLTRARVDVAGAVLPPVLNDVLIAHPSPGAVSRYSVHVPRLGGGAGVGEDGEEAMESAFRSGVDENSANTGIEKNPLWFHVRSSGLRVCTAAGSTAAMRSAGGEPMHFESRELQFMDREPIYFDHAPPPSSGHGFYTHAQKMKLRWNSRVGTVFLDGAHVTHDVRMGDSITISGDAPELRLFTSPWFRRNHSNMWPDRRDAMRHGDAKNEPAEDGLLGDRDWIIDGK